MRLRSVFAAAVFISIASGGFAQPKDVPPPVPAKIDAVAWLKGYWVGEGYGGTVETLMGPPKAGVMLCNFRHMKPDGKPGFYELCGIEEHEGTLRFVIKHFHPNWVGWEEKDFALQAKLMRISKDEVVFGNMTIRRTGKDAIEMELVIANKDGSSRKEILRFKRQPL